MKAFIPIVALALLTGGLAQAQTQAQAQAPRASKIFETPLYHWKPAESNPVLTPGEKGAWDENIRERMWVLYEDGQFQAWYAGWQGAYDKKQPNLVHLGRATSEDGLTWKKDPDNPIFTERWTEDMCVVKEAGVYYMYAEDETNNQTEIHLLTSSDGKKWTAQGTVLSKNQEKGFEASWVATPVVWKEKEAWFMLYEGGPPGAIALARSADGRNWLRFPGNPVFSKGKGDWEKKVTAPDCILKKDNRYVLFYHACGLEDEYRSGIALSNNLVIWGRHAGNPINEGCSPVVVESPKGTFLYVSKKTEKGDVVEAYVPGPAPEKKAEAKQ